MKTPRKSSPRHKVTVEIGGEKHVLRSDVPPEYTRAVAAHVDATLRALPGFATLEPHRAAILAALSITDELLRAREEIRFLRDEAERRTVAAAELLESTVSPGAAARENPADSADSAEGTEGSEPEDDGSSAGPSSRAEE